MSILRKCIINTSTPHTHSAASIDLRSALRVSSTAGHCCHSFVLFVVLSPDAVGLNADEVDVVLELVPIAALAVAAETEFQMWRRWYRRYCGYYEVNEIDVYLQYKNSVRDVEVDGKGATHAEH